MRVLIAFDGSVGAAQAVALCEGIDWPAGSMIRVVSVMEPTTLQLLPWAMGAAPPVLEQDVIACIEAEQSTVVGRLSAPDRVVDAVLLRDRPASGLVDQAREFAADLVIVGSRGHGPIVSLLLGSVSAEVVDHAPCPVLVARRSTLERVAFATDGSTTAAAAEDVLAHWPIFASVPIRVVSVADVVRPWTTGVAPTMYTQVLNAYAKDVAEAEAEHLGIATGSAKRLADAGRWADAEMRKGDAAAEIIAVAQESSADLVVVGSRGQTGLKRIVLGSVARNVLAGSDASVLVIHQPAEA
jgi:nucleotide-binding universal stress UspA family protein